MYKYFRNTKYFNYLRNLNVAILLNHKMYIHKFRIFKNKQHSLKVFKNLPQES